MPEKIDEEVDAIKAVLLALEPLTSDARVSVMDYVSKRLGISARVSAELPSTVVRPLSGAQLLPIAPQEVHLKEFTKQKSPRSANEMAAVVAYYLGELVALPQRKKSITADDIKTYFKIGDFPLPDVRFTLPNAKNAGYFDALGDGEYQLNAVGHNLVAHSLPRSGTTKSRRAGAKKARVKRTAK
jgi:hypothetical protein